MSNGFFFFAYFLFRWNLDDFSRRRAIRDLPTEGKFVQRRRDSTDNRNTQLRLSDIL